MIQLRDGGRRKRGSTAAACNTIRGTEREEREDGKRDGSKPQRSGSGDGAGREPGREGDKKEETSAGRKASVTE